LGDGFTFRIIRVASNKPALDALYDYAAKVVYGFGLFEVPVQVYYKPVAPLCSGLAAVKMRNSLSTLRDMYQSYHCIVVRVRQWVTTHD
jgi:hypothetical protein